MVNHISITNKKKNTIKEGLVKYLRQQGTGEGE